MCLGELSEEQKVALEQNRSRLKHQERELNLLREKLSQMSSLAEGKDCALKAAAEELRYTLLCPDILQKLLCRFPAADGISVCPREPTACVGSSELSTGVSRKAPCELKRGLSGAHAGGRGVTKRMLPPTLW